MRQDDDIQDLYESSATTFYHKTSHRIVLRIGVILLASGILAVSSLAAARADMTWVPTGPGDPWSQIRRSEPIAVFAVGLGKRCTVYQAVWQRGSTKETLTHKENMCDDPGSAQSALAQIELDQTPTKYPSIFGPGIDSVYRRRTSTGGEELIRTWVQGSEVQALAIDCGSLLEDACRDENEYYSRALQSSTSGELAKPRPALREGLQQALILTPLDFWILFFLLPDVFRSIFKDRFKVPPGSKRWSDVSPAGTRKRYKSYAWSGARVLKYIGYLLIALAATSAVVGGPSVISRQYLIAVSVSAAMAIGGHIIQRGLADPAFIDGASALARIRAARLTPSGIALRGLARGLVGICGIYYITVATFIIISTSLPLYASDKTNDAIDLVNAGKAGPQTVFALYLLQRPGDALFAILFILPILLGALVIDQVGKAVLARSAKEVIAGDQRPPILFLRNFGDDNVRIRAARFSRRGVLGRLSLRRSRRFEEVITWRIAEFGPLVAVQDGRKYLRQLGAAKFTFNDEEWQSAVRDLAADSFAVIISAAPSELNDGLLWELDMLAHPGFHQRIVLLLPPRRKRALQRGWDSFVAATASLPIFRPICILNQTLAAQVMVHVPGDGWYAWGARTRSEWTYAEAIRSALAFAVSRWRV